MAHFDRTKQKEIIDFFQQLGYEVKNFDEDSKTDYWEEFIDDYGKTYGVQWLRPRIQLVGYKINDKWLVQYSTFAGTYELENQFTLDEKGMLKFIGKPNSWKLELVSEGSKILQSGEEILYDEDEYKTANEFANFENFDSIDAPDYSAMYADDPQVSIASPYLNIDELTDSQLKKAQEKIQQSKNALAELIEAQKKGDIADAMWTFDEVDELYNSKITDADKRAFFIYLQNKNRKKLSGDWDKKYGSPYPAEATTIIELMKKGALFYDPSAKIGERLQPKVIYKSGNLWKKWGSLTNKKEEYIKRFGQGIYELHEQTLKPVFENLYENRLKVKGEKSMRLHLVPIANLTRDFKITSYLSPLDKIKVQENHLIYTSRQKGELISDYTRISQSTKDAKYFINKKTITLLEGFILWCREAGRGKQAVENGVQFSTITPSIEELLDYYIKPKNNPFSKDKNGKDRWERTQDDARKVGERLFAQFLDEGLNEEDQLRLETLWNSVYNAFVEPILDEVPIGFTYKKYLAGISLFLLRDSNLRAIRYYLTRGSIGLAYGVGLGKTFCSIFAIKQALDLGLAKRPLILVPNQVYFQFGNEIVLGLGSDFDPTKKDSRLNMFYNGVDKVNNYLGNNAVDGINLATYEALESFQFDKKNVDMAWVEYASNILEMGGDDVSLPIKEKFVKEHSETLFNVESIESNEDDSTELDIAETIDENADEDFDIGDTFDEGGNVEGKKKKRKILDPIIINQESVNFDMLVVDEAHNFNNLFKGILSEPKSASKDDDGLKKILKISREKNPYASIRETNSKGSARAEKLFFLARYIQYYNKMGNTILLSATPFTNSPIQLYSMLSMLNYEMLFDADLGIIKDFFDTYSKVEYAEDFSTDLTIVKRTKFVGWSNVISLQKYVYRLFDKSSKEEEDKAVIRPNKWTLPLKRQVIDGKLIEFAKENYISTTIRMSDFQLELWNKVRNYARGFLRYEALFAEENRNTTYLGKYEEKKPKKEKTTSSSDEEAVEVEVQDAEDLTDGTLEGEKAKNTAKALQCLMWGRQIALNPYLFAGSGFKEKPTAKMYVEQSPKLLYVMECIRSVKAYYDANPKLGYWWKDSDTEEKVWVSGMSGQVIYMSFGTKAFELIRDYLVEELGFNMDEIGIIRGDTNMIGKKRYDSKIKVQDAFLGQTTDPVTGIKTPISSDKRVKVLIGSEAIKEGINLQNYASVLYNCFLDFNPTDQVQLEGRIWRQGNALSNVRIVIPLMSDCIDVFMFQKLQDKTERINQIWTKNGNLNELDTTAFNPSELKYELLTDPVAIAELERVSTFEKLDEQKIQEGEILSSYLILENTYKSYHKLVYEPLSANYFYVYTHFGLYYNLCQIRPDLIDKPLLNEEFYKEKFAKGIYELDPYFWKGHYYDSVEQLIEKYPTIYHLGQKSVDFKGEIYNSPYNLWSNNVTDPLWRQNLKGCFNYSTEDLIQLMVKVLKEQKIGYPRGYSKNWRELVPKVEPLIVDGDEVEFDTKSGRKRGIAELVKNKYNQLILPYFYQLLSEQVRDNTTDEKNLIDTLSRLKIKDFDLDSLRNSVNFSELSEKQKNNLILILKEYYSTNPNKIMGMSVSGSLIPYKLDVGELEDLDVVIRNITKVKKDVQEIEVKDKIYPEAFTYSSKDRNKNLEDIAQYLSVVAYSKSYELSNYSDEKIKALKWLSQPINEQFPFFTSYFQCIIQILQMYNMKIGSNSLETFEAVGNYNIANTWAEFIDKSKDSDFGGLFRIGYSKFYETSYAITLSDFKREEEKKLKPMGINTYSDILNLVIEQKTKINTLSLEQDNLMDAQVFTELVQEVQRKQAELNSDVIRAGSSFKARAISFATPNSDYLGNEMLSIFRNVEENNNPKPSLIIEKQEVGVIEQVTSPTQRLIDDLEEALEFESPREKKKTLRIIQDLREAMEFE
jgi:hypothetical protein